MHFKIVNSNCNIASMINPMYNPYLSDDEIPFQECILFTRDTNIKQVIKYRKRLRFKTLKKTSSQLLLRRRKILPYGANNSFRIRARTL